MPYQYLLYETQDAIVTLTLNRPDRLNALGETLREELYDAIVRASDDPQARVIVLTSAGLRIFQSMVRVVPSNVVWEKPWKSSW